MTKKGLLVAAFVAVLAFTIGYTGTVKAWHTQNNGYFYHLPEYGAWWDVWQPSWRGWTGDRWDCWGGDGQAIPYGVDSANELINYVTCKLWAGSARDHVGAAMMISSMTGVWSYDPPDWLVDEFARRINYAASRGWINFGGADSCSQPNTFYQSTRVDVAYYWGCASGGNSAIIIYGGSQPYILKRYCGNPVGTMGALADDINFNMTGYTTIVNQTNAARGSSPYPGDQLQFRHWVRNDGPTGTNTDIFALAENTAPAYAVVGGWGNFGGYGAGETKNPYNPIVNIPAGASAGAQYCQRTGFSPVNSGGAVDGRGPPVCATVAYNFSLNPSITAVINGVNGPVSGSIAEPGDTITFTYGVNNSGTTASQATTCTYRRAVHTGYSTAAPTTVFVPTGANCPPARTFPPGVAITTTTATEAGVVAGANTSVCRSFTISPLTQAGGSRTVQSCVHVASKPYARAYGGDVSVGGGLAVSPSAPTSCSQNNAAAIVGWNRRAGAGPAAFAGAGVQFAAYAMSTIFDTATSLGNGGGAAATPTGLSFANTSVSVVNGNFGGRFGLTECMRDYFAEAPAAATSWPGNISNLTSGVHKINSNSYISGSANIDPGERITLYVDGDLYLNANVTYVGAWTSGSIPSFRLVVRGDLYIDLGVTRLDGLYVAQPNGASGGTIYTCASTLPVIPTIPANNSLASQCRNKLTVNGGFVAKQVRLMRTAGTLRQSAANETSAANAAAEVFNYNPALWIAQPAGESSRAEYESITSLPPVL